MKKIWISSLPQDQQAVTTLLQQARQYGLTADGHFWLDDLAKMTWQTPAENLLAADCGLWLIIGSEADLTPSVRYGLGLLALLVQARKSNGLPVLWLNPQAGDSPLRLPTPLQGAEQLALTAPGLGAKLVARANTPTGKASSGYRLDVHANPSLGIWLEVGPGTGINWNGALLGVGLAGEIDFHGVGPAGKLPQKATLEYPQQGLKLALGSGEYLAWAVRNQLDPQTSYYVRVRETPAALLFGPYPDQEEAEFHLIEF